ncbi:hypothetical protein KW796_00985 [Candidatus Parcubacteria bacterium]|nr:hypothetical protein [Candidatus Parcubacteria bacterium]
MATQAGPRLHVHTNGGFVTLEKTPRGTISFKVEGGSMFGGQASSRPSECDQRDTEEVAQWFREQFPATQSY